MAKNTFNDFDTTASSNTDIAGIDIQGTAAVANFDNALRTLMALLRSGVPGLTLANVLTKTQTWAKGADVASATALTLGTDGNYFDITGTTSITSITTIGAGTVVKLHFDGILTLTHHATNLILPTGVNITTAAGDEAEFVEYATGTWRCTNYQSANRIMTPWVAYTPTFTGVGTVTSLKCRSRRNGPDIEVEAYWNNGTVTASDFSMSLGFNGTNGSGVCAAYWDGFRPVVGTAIWNIDGAASLCVLGLGSSNLVNIGVSSSGRDSFELATGTVLGTGTAMSVRFSLPIEGWN